MANSSINIPKTHLIMALCLPLAVLLGYVLADPMESGSLAVVVFILVILSVPLLMKWHHPLLILSWNALITPAFIPGHAPLWLAISFVALLIAILNRATDPTEKFVTVPSINKAIFFLVAVVILTGIFTGGFGVRFLGSARQGGKSFILLLGALVGYFALTSRRIPLQRAWLYTALFFLPGLLAIVSNLIYLGGPAFYFLFEFFSPELARDQANAAASLGGGISRISGLSLAAPAITSWLLARFGIRGLFDFTKPWRSALFVLALVASLYGGYRSVLVMFALTFAILFFLEGLHRTRYLFSFGAIAIICFGLLIPFASSLPLSAQRTLSVLPGLKLDPMARDSAEGSSEWRLDMWREAVTEIPPHLLLGKGYALDARIVGDDINMTRDPLDKGWSIALRQGDYHNGPLSVLIPFGLWGALALVWFLYVGLRYLFRQFKSGDPNLHSINRLLLAAFAARVIFFFFIFGSLFSDMAIFAGLLGFSVSLNGAETAHSTEQQPEAIAALDPDFIEA